MADSSQGSSSVSAFVTNLIVNGVIFFVFIILFIILKPKEKRIYQPRTFVESVPKEIRPEESPKGAFAWVNYLVKKPESFIIQQAGPDGYFFLRYIFFYSTVLVIAGIIAMVVLLPINATGGNHGSGFDILSYSNVSTAHKNRVYAHSLVSWFFFGMIIFGIYRELRHYVAFMHAFQTSPYIDSLISSRMLLVTALPKDLKDDEAALKHYFPAATSIVFARDYKDLEKDIKERTKLAGKYEGALNKVVNKAVKMKAKADKKNKPLEGDLSALETYFVEKKQPHHKLKPIIGKKVNTIDYANEQLPELNEKISKQQNDYLSAEANGSVFIEFPNQVELQKALQAVKYNKVFRGCRAIPNVTPESVVWDNLKNSNVQRLGKKTVAVTILVLLLIFWAIPVAVVGAISNINFLTDKVHFLRFINNMPSKLLGIITGLLPTVLLAVLMSLVPPFIKFMGKFSGLVTIQQLDLWVQDWYYAFQVIQVFLVTTCASAATSVVTKIIKKPDSAMSLLAENLPKASNFYICYILFVGFSIPSGALLQLVALILSKVLGFLQNTPRKKWVKYHTLNQPGWAINYSVYGLLGVITLCYAIISPIILVFGMVSFTLIYFAWLYNLTYVFAHTFDSRGRHFPKAMFQIFVGLYLAELCLTALFVMNKSWGPMGIEIGLLVFTVASHLYMKWRFIPLYHAIPISGIYEAAGTSSFTYPNNDQGLKEVKETGKSYWDSVDTSGTTNVEKNYSVSEKIKYDDSSSEHQNVNSSSGRVQPLPVGDVAEADGSRKPDVGALKRFFNPKVYLSFREVRKKLPSFLNAPTTYDAKDTEKNQYLNPAIHDGAPFIWIPQDKMGLSKTLIAKASGKVDVSDANTTFDEKNKLNYTGPPPDYDEAMKVYSSNSNVYTTFISAVIPTAAVV